MKLTTTLARIRSHSPCREGYTRLVKSLGGIEQYGADTPVNLLTILDANGAQDMLWCLRATIEDSRAVAERLVTEFVAEANAMTSYYLDDSLAQRRRIVHERLRNAAQLIRNALGDPADAAYTTAAEAAAEAADAADTYAYAIADEAADVANPDDDAAYENAYTYARARAGARQAEIIRSILTEK